MDDRLKESISALLDDEADELETRRILNKSGDNEVRALWERYNKVSDVLSSGREAHDQFSPMDVDISSRISQAIDNEDELGVVDLDKAVSLEKTVNPKEKSNTAFIRWVGVAAALVLSVSIVSVGFDNGELLTDAGLSVLEEPYLAPEHAQKLNEYMLRHAGNSVTGGRSGLMPLVRVASLSMTAY